MPLTAKQQESYNKAKGIPVRAVEIPKTVPIREKEPLNQQQDKEIEEILKSIQVGDLAQEAVIQPKQPEDLPDRVAQGLRDVFQPKTTVAEEMETAATKEPSTATEEQGYIVKDLEPEDMTKGTEFKPFHLGNAMTMEVKAEAPKSEMFSSDGAKTEAFKTDTKGLEIDLEALLAETANELAQAVAEDTEEVAEEAVEEATEEVAEEVVEEATEEVTEEVVEEATENILPAPAAAKAAMIAENLSAVFEEKANEIEALAAEKEEEEASEEATREIPVEEVKEAMENIDFTQALEQEESHIKRVVASAVDETQKSTAFQTAVEGLIKALCKERQMEGAKVAFITAEELNKKDPIAVVGKLSGGFLVVENAGELNGDVVEDMSKAMEFKTNRLTVILEDLKPGIRSLEEKYPEFIKKFDSRIVIPVFTNDELVSFAKTYAKDLGYKIDDMAVLALYTLIGHNQNEENPVTIGTVREMMDEAIKRASKKGRRLGKKVAKRHLDDESGRIMLYEKDFDI